MIEILVMDRDESSFFKLRHVLVEIVRGIIRKNDKEFGSWGKGQCQLWTIQ